MQLVLVRLAVGSSPRARGTPHPVGPRQRRLRFIPASAGNTWSASARWSAMSVHPRERGEHPPATIRLARWNGSSPRARGTRRVRNGGEMAPRFIPASAGNTSWQARGASALSVHPRERGEHRWAIRAEQVRPGSSPRARGTHRRADRRHPVGRFIPASAGNTALSALRATPDAVHPRERGEHSSRARQRPAASGSSPRARGTLIGRRHRDIEHRFIPASAGNTARTSAKPPPISGSSPRARGTPSRVASRGGGGRFIPASAGNTPSSPRWWP